MKRLLKIIVSLGAFYLLFTYLSDPREMLSQIARMSLASVGLAFLLNTLNRFLMAYKWLRLLASRGEYMPLLQAVKIYCASTIWGMFLPATMGADGVRAGCSVLEGLSGREILASIAIERLIGMMATALLAFGSLFLLYWIGNLTAQLETIWLVSAGVLGAGIVAGFLLLNSYFFDLLHKRWFGQFSEKKIFQLIESVHRAIYMYRSQAKEIAVFFVLTVLENSFPIVVTWIIAQGIGSPVPLVQLACAVPLAYLVARVPFSIGGIGVFEGTFVLVLTLFGVSPDVSLGIAVLNRILQIVVWLPWWFMYMAQGVRKPPGPVEQAAD